MLSETALGLVSQPIWNRHNMPPASPKSVLFVCTGNCERTRFAEIVFNSVADKMRLPWRATSRGLAPERSANNPGALAKSAVQMLQAMGIDDLDDVSRLPIPVVSDDFQAASWIVALNGSEDRPLLDRQFPGWVEQVEFWQVDDVPLSLQQIQKEVMDLAARLITGGRRRIPSDVQPAENAQATRSQSTRKALKAQVGWETAGRRGKGVTTVFDLPLDDGELQELAGVLKQRCGTGGTVKNRRIEIQGDQRERIVSELERLGYLVKRR